MEFNDRMSRPQGFIYKRIPSVQPSIPKIATSSTTLRALSAPIAPTAIGREGSVKQTNPLTSSYVRDMMSRPQGSIYRGIPSAQPIMPAGASGFTPIPSASAAPLGGGAIATAPSPGGFGGIADSIVSTTKSYIPLAIKIVLAVIVFKIVLWLIRGKKR